MTSPIPFVIISTPSAQYPVVVLSRTAQLPWKDSQALVQQLRSINASGLILFDLLTANGSRHNRFFEYTFNGVALDNFKVNKVPGDNAVREACAAYVRTHLDSFDLSLLTPAMRFAVERGIPL